MPGTQVLIAGAGPTGLVLALYLTKLHVQVRVFDKTDAPGTTSRALVLHARNLEFYRQLGIVEEAIEGGLKFDAVNLWAKAKPVARVPIGDIGKGLSTYPYVLIYPQDEHEKLLIRALERLGVQVERKTELLSFEQAEGLVRARLRKADGTEEIAEARYLAGCDGASSTVREQLGTGFPGGTYADVFYVADIVAEGPPVNRELHVALDFPDFVAIFPLKDAGNVRLVGNIGKETGNVDDLGWEDVGKRVIERLKLSVKEVRWFSVYHVHHRVATSFRVESVFLLGDAAHIHSPVGGQGMNTGIGDAVNLAWKLAAVLQERIDPSVLDTYEPERIAFAKKLVKSTDRAFQLVTAHGLVAINVRLRLIPFLLPKLVAFKGMRKRMFTTLSQIRIRYRKSELSAGLAGMVHGGDRLPWVELRRDANGWRDNYVPLDALDWQVHCYGEVSEVVRAVCEKRGIALHVFAWRRSMRRAGIRRNALYLVRPDGHIGLSEPTADAAKLEKYLDEHGIKTRTAKEPGRREPVEHFPTAKAA